MTWKSHIAITSLGAFALTGSPTLSALAAAGNLLPDKIENIVPILQHRGNAHSVLLWALLCAGAWMIPSSYSPIAIYLFPLACGGLAHTLQDMCSVTGVPFLPGKKPRRAANTLKIPLYKTGAPSEAITTFLTLAAFSGIIYLKTSL